MSLTLMKQNINPFAYGDAGTIADIICELMPTAPEMSPSEQLEFDTKCREGEARYQEARYGALPAGTYRILEQGGIAGWHRELEIDGDIVVLKEPGEPFRSALALFSDKKRTDEIARAEIERRYGKAEAQAARFRIVWGGKL